MEIVFQQCDALDGMTSMREVARYFQEQGKFYAVDQVNWREVSHFCPRCEVSAALSPLYIYVYFSVTEPDLRAVNTANLSPVADDSCVEFFLRVPGSPEYWNFEFNCIGAVNASHRVVRPEAVRLNDAEIAAIKRYASLGSQPFQLLEGEQNWSLTVAIPRHLIGLAPNATSLTGNFYKCGAKTLHPHYLSLFPIHLDKPNFHCPEFFGAIHFEK